MIDLTVDLWYPYIMLLQYAAARNTCVTLFPKGLDSFPYRASCHTYAAGYLASRHAFSLIYLTVDLWYPYIMLLQYAAARNTCISADISVLPWFGRRLFNLFQEYFKRLAERLKKSGKNQNPAVLFFDGAAADTDNSKSISENPLRIL